MTPRAASNQRQEEVKRPQSSPVAQVEATVPCTEILRIVLEKDSLVSPQCSWQEGSKSLVGWWAWVVIGGDAADLVCVKQPWR